MASSKAQPVLTTPSINPQQSIQLLQRQIEKGKSLLEGRALIQEDDYHAWVSTTSAVLEKAFGTASGKNIPFLNIGYGPGAERRSLNSKLSFLGSCIEQLELDIELGLPSMTSSEVSVSHPYVFISYSHIDSELADAIASDLSALGIQHFLDRKDINWGQSIGQRVQEALKRCSHQIIILSPASIKSPWVHYEIGFAKGAGTVALPFLTHPSLDIPGYFADLLCKSRREDVKAYFQILLGDKI